MLLVVVAQPRRPLLLVVLLLLLLRGRARKQEVVVEGAISDSVSLLRGRPVPLCCCRVLCGCVGGRGGSE